MKIKHISIRICEACLNGEGQECHTPGCALFMHSVDLPIDPGLYQVLDEYEEHHLTTKSSRPDYTEACSCKPGMPKEYYKDCPIHGPQSSEKEPE